MEISFWQFLAKEPDADALPLKQRIPEVALFRGCSLYAGFFSNQRGLLQKRSTTQYSKQFLLDRLLALSAKTADATDLCARTPAAILRRPQKPGMAGPPKTQVLNASQLMELLERTERGSMPGTFGLPAAVPQLEEDEDWSLQSLIVPQTNLRVVSVYSREANGEECLDLVGQPFSQVYPIDGPEPPAPPPAGPPRDPSLRSVFIPEAFASQVEMKSRHLAAYVQRFHGRALASLISEFIPDESGKAVLHGFWKVELLEGKSMAQSYARDFGLESPLPSTAVPSTVDSHTSRPTSASWSAASRPVSAQEDPSQVAANAARRAMSEDLHIQEDDTEDNELEEAIERMRASEPSGPRRAARCGRTMPGVDEATAAPAATGAGSLPTPTPSSVPAAQMPPRPSSGSRPNTERTMGCADDIAARTASLSSRIRPRSAEQRSVRSAPASSRPSSARSVPSAARGPRNWSVQSSSFSARVVGQIRCDQLISRHLPEREARLKMISVLARQLERLRDHIPAFAQQWQTVEAFIETCQQRVSDKVKEVERSEEEIQRLQQLHSRQYDLLVQHLQRQVEEAKSAWKSRRRHLEACKQEEYELHQKVVAKEQQTQAVKSALDKTWRRMEEMQRSVSEKRTTLEARANGDWSRDLDDGDGTCRQMAEEINRHMQVRQEVSSYRSQIQAALEVLAQQRAYSLQLEDFIRKISGGGGRYVLPLPLKREAQRHMKAAAKQHKEAATLSEAF